MPEDFYVYLKGVSITSLMIMTDGFFTQEYVDYVRKREEKQKKLGKVAESG